MRTINAQIVAIRFARVVDAAAYTRAFGNRLGQLNMPPERPVTPKEIQEAYLQALRISVPHALPFLERKNLIPSFATIDAEGLADAFIQSMNEVGRLDDISPRELRKTMLDTAGRFFLGLAGRDPSEEQPEEPEAEPEATRSPSGKRAPQSLLATAFGMLVEGLREASELRSRQETNAKIQRWGVFMSNSDLLSFVGERSLRIQAEQREDWLWHLIMSNEVGGFTRPPTRAEFARAVDAAESSRPWRRQRAS